MVHIRKAHRWAGAPLAAILVLALLLGAVAAGLQVPGSSLLGRLPGGGALDYRTLTAGTLSPLRPDYVDELLGARLADREQAEPAAAVPPAGSTSPVAARPATDTGATAPRRATVVEHDLTNDDMRRPIVIPTLPYAARTDTTGATRQQGEPSGCSRTGGTAWYRYTALRDGQLTADTFGSDHATAIGVFRQSTGAGVQQVACATGATEGARVAFAGTRGASYLLQVTSLVRGGRLAFHLAALGRTSLLSGDVEDRTPATAVRWAALSGDGTTVAFLADTVVHCSVTCGVGQVHATDLRTGRTTLVSKSSTGEAGNLISLDPTISDDGRYVGFASDATNLVPGDTNGARDMFVHDRVTGRTTLVSVDSQGRQGTRGTDRQSYGIIGSLSADGRFVTFHTNLGGLVADDPPGTDDVFVRDLKTGTTTRENVHDDGERSSAQTYGTPRISADGRLLAFVSTARDLVEADYPSCSGEQLCANLFLRDRWTGTTRLVSVDRLGQADMDVWPFDMSQDGSVLAWRTSTPLDRARDTNGVADVYVVDARSAVPRRVSVSSAGAQANAGVGTGAVTDVNFYAADTLGWVSVSADGTHVAFDSHSTNLVPGDTNGSCDVFLHDLRSGVTTRASVSSSGAEADGPSGRPAVSRGGAVVVFESDAKNLAPGDSNERVDVYAHDLSST